MVERRQGGETGICAVQCLEGADVWEAERAGRWSRDLLDAALGPVEDKRDGNIQEHCSQPAVFMLEYNDGLSAAVFVLNGYMQSWGYAGRVAGKAQGMEVHLPGPPYPHFSYLSLNIQQMFLTGKPAYPVERTLLVAGALDALMESRYRGHIRIETPHLNVHYQSYQTPPIRPTEPRPKGASLVPFDSPVTQKAT